MRQTPEAVRYHRRSAFYMLARLTNNGKEKVDLSNLSIEHVLPQKERLAPEWRAMLGDDWKEIQAEWLHRLGNLTLTAFNSEFQAKPFPDKKMRDPGGYAKSPVWLNQSVAACDSWGPKQIRARGEMLAQKAVEIWKPLVADARAIEEAELQEALADAVGLAVEEIPCTEKARPFFDALVEFARGLDNEVREVPQARSVVYRTPAWFVELLPRVNRVIIRLALDPEEGADITSELESASDWEFIVNSVVTGGSIFRVRDEEELAVAKKLIHRAHEIAIAE